MRLATKEFITHLAGFLKVREKLDNVAKTVLPEELASQYESVGMDETPLQDEKLIKEEEDPSTYSIEDRLADMLDIAGVDIKPLLDQFGRALVDKLKALNGGNADDHYPKYKSAPLKSQKRSAEKVRNEYDGVALRILDLVRASIVVNTEPQLATLLDTVFNTSSDEKFEHIQVVRFKNRFKYPTFSGYRDALFNLRITSKSGQTMIVELQIHLNQVMEHKPESHFYYGFFRKFFLGNMDVVSARMELLTSLGSYVKDIKLDIHPNESHDDGDDEPPDIESILRNMVLKKKPDEIDPQRFEKEMNNPDNKALQALLAKLVPFWELQDATDGASPDFSEIEEYEDIDLDVEDRFTKTGDGTSVSAIDEVYEVLESLKPDLDAFADKLIKNLAVYMDTDARVCDWTDSPSTEREEDDGNEAIDSLEYDGSSLITRSLASSLASKYKINVSEVWGMLNASITVSDEYYLEYIFQFMTWMHENNHIELLHFHNEFQNEKVEGYKSFFAYRKAEYAFRLTGESGSTLVALNIHHALLKPFEKDWMYYLNVFFVNFLDDDDWDLVEHRVELLDSLEILVKERMVTSFVGQLEDVIELLITNRDVENLSTFESLLGPKMLSDMSVAILCSRGIIRALELKMEDGASIPKEALLDARLALGENLLMTFFSDSKLDTLEALETLEAVYEEMKDFYNDEKHPKVLRAAMQYHSALTRVVPDKIEDVSHCKAVLDNFIDVFGPDDEATIECSLVYGQILFENDHEQDIEVLQAAYDKALGILGESHFVTLNCGADLAIAIDDDDGISKSYDYLQFVEKVYKTYSIVLGRTKPLLVLESTLLSTYQWTIDENSDAVTDSEYDRIKREIARIGALNKKGYETGELFWSSVNYQPLGT